MKQNIISDLRGVMVSMLTSHVGGRGSIPRLGEKMIILQFFAYKMLFSISVSCQSTKTMMLLLHTVMILDQYPKEFFYVH